jgi:hypothetical protein
VEHLCLAVEIGEGEGRRHGFVLAHGFVVAHGREVG